MCKYYVIVYNTREIRNVNVYGYLYGFESYIRTTKNRLHLKSKQNIRPTHRRNIYTAQSLLCETRK